MKDDTHGPAPGFFTIWWRIGALFPIILAVFTVFLAVVSVQSLKLGLAFDADGVVVSATVSDRREKTVRRDDRTDTDYYVTFDYKARGEFYSVEKKVGSTLYKMLALGATRDIRHLSTDPRKMEHTIGKTWDDGQTARWISLALGIGALSAFWWTARSAIEAVRARRFGKAEWATVVFIDERVHRNKNSTTTTYVLVWRDQHGEQGESLSSSSDSRYSEYGPNSKIEVFRDSKGKTWWVGDVGPRAPATTVPSVGKT